MYRLGSVVSGALASKKSGNMGILEVTISPRWRLYAGRKNICQEVACEQRIRQLLTESDLEIPRLDKRQDGQRWVILLSF